MAYTNGRPVAVLTLVPQKGPKYLGQHLFDLKTVDATHWRQF